MQSSWRDAASEVLRENTAQAIHQQLEELDNQRDKYAQRWVWELFQNAVDASQEGHPIEIQIRQLGNSLLFRHNGAPFNQKEILHLIFHGSTKRERTGVIGRYGTGFLTTHVLSRKVRISGELNTEERFDFVLDRTGGTPSELANAMEVSFGNLQRSIRSPEGESSHTTEFEYQLDDLGMRLVETALQTFRQIAPFVIAFNRAITGIEIQHRSTLRLSAIAESKHESVEGGRLIEIGDPEGDERSSCFVIDDPDVTIAVPLEGQRSRYKVSLPTGLPRLFVAFPLFGTETVPLPFVLNCSHAKPTEKRDGLFLGRENTADNLQNKRYVERGWDLFARILDQVGELGWGRLFNLGRVGLAPECDWLDKAWLDGRTAQELASRIIPAPLVEIEGAKPLPVASVRFPTPPVQVQATAFRNLVAPVCGSAIIPASDVTAVWCELLSEWSGLMPLTNLGLTTITLPDLGRRIAGFGGLVALGEQISKEAAETFATDPMDWLNSFLDTLFVCEGQSSLDRDKLLPNQLGTFQLRSQLKKDDGVDRELKSISQDLGDDLRSTLLDKRCHSSAQGLLPTLTTEAVAAFLLSLVVSKAKTQYGGSDYRRANVALFTWFGSRRQLDSLKQFPLLTSETDPAGHEKPIVGREQFLAPVQMWPPTAQPFRDLFPPSSIASAAYAQMEDPETWAWLQSQQVCMLDPVILQTRDIAGEDLAGMLERPFQGEEEDLEHRIQSFEVVDLAHLTPKDKGIIDTVRNSKTKATLLLKFIVAHLLAKTSESLQYVKKTCLCGREHSMHCSLWISTLKNRQWVYERKGHAARATSANVARIWKEDSELMQAIKQGDVILFLRRLEINASEIQRSALSESESDSIAMEKAMVALISANNNDPQKLQRLADISSSDPDFLEEYEIRLKQRERVRLNQSVGAAVEALFRAVFEAPELKALGLRIKRTGWGSDFCIEHDLVDERGEVAFQLETEHGNSFLVELKSTFGSAVLVSETQGNEAANKRDSFALCVVPLQAGSIDLTAIKATLRFVPEIGRLLTDKAAELKSLRQLEMRAASSADNVDVLIEGTQIHYKIKEPVWTAGLDLEQFIEFLLRHFEISQRTRASAL